MSSFYIQNFGCRATQADGAAIERQFHDRGFARTMASADADIVVLNTCTVTASADRDARAAIRRLHRENPACQIVVTGCYAQRAPEEIAALPGVSRVIGNSHKHGIAEIASGNSSFVSLSELTANAPIYVSDIFAHTEFLAAPVGESGNERTRPNLKVQDGCDNRCSFCVIPSVRGRSRSLSLSGILSEVDALVAAGDRELVISGINLGRWGRDFGTRERLGFEDLIRAILRQTSLQKLRISSVEPMDWSDELIGLMAESPRIAKHAHLPLQSGSDRVLRRMHRRYRPWHYRERIVKIRAAMPTAAIGADVMVGFPGESDRDFEDTRCFIEDLPFTYLHVFSYSARPGTPAAAMPDQVAPQIVRERNQILRQLGEQKKLAFMRALIGEPMHALTLNRVHNRRNGDFTEALSDNFLKMLVPGCHLANQWVRARAEQMAGDMLVTSVPQDL